MRGDTCQDGDLVHNLVFSQHACHLENKTNKTKHLEAYKFAIMGVYRIVNKAYIYFLKIS